MDDKLPRIPSIIMFPLHRGGRIISKIQLECFNTRGPFPKKHRSRLGSVLGRDEKQTKTKEKSGHENLL